MNKQEKLNYLQNNHFSEWLKTREEVENELSDKQEVFCICGRLATGLHESNCRKFRNRVESETIKKLEYLFNVKKEANG